MNSRMSASASSGHANIIKAGSSMPSPGFAHLLGLALCLNRACDGRVSSPYTR